MWQPPCLPVMGAVLARAVGWHHALTRWGRRGAAGFVVLAFLGSGGCAEETSGTVDLCAVVGPCADGDIFEADGTVVVMGHDAIDACLQTAAAAYDISTQLVEPLEGSCTTIAQALDATIPDYGDELVDRPRAACEASADGVNAIFATGEDPVACLRAGTCAAHQSSCTWTGLSSPELDAMVAVLDQHAGPVCESQCSDAVSSAMSDLQRCALDLLIQAGRLPEGGCECANRALDEFALIVERYYDVQSAKAVAMTGGVRVSCSDHGGR